MSRAIVIVMDSVGIGALSDAHLYGDTGTHTLAHIYHSNPNLKIPNLISLGLGNITDSRLPPILHPSASYGRAFARSPGKDTTTGHWEMMGITLAQPFPTYPDGFPSRIIQPFTARIQRNILGNCTASGTEIIQCLGQQHQQTGEPIVYTSADSVFQIAAHEQTVPITQLYEWCRIARELLTGVDAVGRVIARPFEGQPSAYKRTSNRHDYAMLPPGDTTLDRIKAAGLPVISIGKINDIFAGKGITESHPTVSNRQGLEYTLSALKRQKEGFIFVNLVDFDMLYGHRRDPAGYGAALEELDRFIPELLAQTTQQDMLIFTADHGCDPTHTGTDHTREAVPILRYQPGKEVEVIPDMDGLSQIGNMVERWLLR